MHLHPEHSERHFTASDTVRDVVVGMSDGLTVPFALAAGISGAIAISHLVVTAGLAEIAAGSIAMGLGGYLAGRSESEHYASERRREESEVKSVPDVEALEIEQIFAGYGLTPGESAPVVQGLRRRPQAWVDFMMRFELGLEKPDPRRALISAATIGGSYALGGIVPLAPYIVVSNRSHSAHRLSRRHDRSARNFWLCKRQVQWGASAHQRCADGGDRQHRRYGGVSVGTRNLVAPARQPFWFFRVVTAIATRTSP